MKTNVIGSQKYIFFLRNSDELPRIYYSLSRILSFWDIILIPVYSHEMSEFLENGKQYLISVSKDMNTYGHFLKFRKKFLDFAMVRKKICLFDISSFSKINIAYKVERLNSYYHFNIPDKLDKICSEIATIYQTENNKEDAWPGGKRAKLPPLTS